MQNRCFNCGSSDHPLRDCPVPRNDPEIRKNRTQFRDARPSKPV